MSNVQILLHACRLVGLQLGLLFELVLRKGGYLLQKNAVCYGKLRQISNKACTTNLAAEPYACRFEYDMNRMFVAHEKKAYSQRTD